MADNDPLAEMFNLFAAPLAGTIRSFDQFRKGVDEFLRGVENFNRTMESLNETAERINGLLADIEEPIKAAVPQITRTVKAADEMMQVVAGPAMAVAPGLMKLSDTLNNPAFQQMPNQIGQMTELLSDVTSRLAPLGQLAESAGGLFGGFKLSGFGGPAPASRSTSTRSADVQAETVTPPANQATKAAARRAAPKKAAPKKRAAKKRAAKKRAAKTTAARKATARKTSS